MKRILSFCALLSLLISGFSQDTNLSFYGNLQLFDLFLVTDSIDINREPDFMPIYGTITFTPDTITIAYNKHKRARKLYVIDFEIKEYDVIQDGDSLIVNYVFDNGGYEALSSNGELRYNKKDKDYNLKLWGEKTLNIYKGKFY